MTMPRAVTAFAVLGAAVAIGACGSSGKSASTGGGSNGTIGVSVGNATVQVPKA